MNLDKTLIENSLFVPELSDTKLVELVT